MGFWGFGVLEPFGAIWSHFEAFGGIWSYLEPCVAIWDHLDFFLLFQLFLLFLCILLFLLFLLLLHVPISYIFWLACSRHFQKHITLRGQRH